MLFNLKSDPSEKTNLSDLEKDLLNQLFEELKAWETEVDT